VKINGVVEPGHELVEGRAEEIGKELLKREGVCAYTNLMILSTEV